MAKQSKYAFINDQNNESLLNVSDMHARLYLFLKVVLVL